MKKRIFSNTLLGLLVIGWIQIAGCRTAEAVEIQWLNYETGIAQARAQEKKIFLHFYASWCGYCKVMDQKTFKDAPVVRYLNKYFIPIKINSDKQRNLAVQYRVRGLPSTWFLKEDGEKIANKPGYISPEQMITFLKFIQTDSYQKMNLQTFLEKTRKP